jgi:hypothetical protein
MPQSLGIPLAVSPDGSRFVYGTTDGLQLRSVNELDARLIAGTDKDSIEPFFSPDGQWIGYWSVTDQKLKKVAVSEGPQLYVIGPLNLGASWNSDNTIVYSDMLTGVMRVSADGGPEVAACKEAFNAHKKAFLYCLECFPTARPCFLRTTRVPIHPIGKSGFSHSNRGSGRS